MNGSYQIGTAFGIPIRIHWSFFVLLAVFLSMGQPWTLLILFGSVLLHELGHSVAAQRFGIRVADITLWPLGGMARLAGMPENPRVETIVALAGPAVNGAIVAICTPLLFLSAALSPFALGLFEHIIKVNVVLGVFNLLPAFPMDGGRVLRAWFARKVDWVQATERASGIGRKVAFVMIAMPFLAWLLTPELTQAVCMFPVIGFFILFAGLQELVATRVRHGMPPIGGMAGGDAFAAAFGSGGARGAREAESEVRFEDQESAEGPDYGRARRPQSWEHAPDRPPQQGFDDEGISALERFRGRLRRGLRDERGDEGWE